MNSSCDIAQYAGSVLIDLTALYDFIETTSLHHQGQISHKLCRGTWLVASLAKNESTVTANTGND